MNNKKALILWSVHATTKLAEMCTFRLNILLNISTYRCQKCVLQPVCSVYVTYTDICEVERCALYNLREYGDL